MDSLATGLAGIIILTVPLLLWFRSKARARYEQELAEIKTLVEERAQSLAKLHSRFDDLEKKDTWQEPTPREEDVVDQSQFWFPMSFPLATGLKENDVRLKWHTAALMTLYSEPGYGKSFVCRVDLRSLEEAKFTPEWWKDESRHESVSVEDSRRKRVWNRVGQGPIGSPA